MGGEQAALTMRIVAQATALRKGDAVDEVKLQALEAAIIENFDRQSSALYTSARLLDDGIIDPRDTRSILGFVLQTCLEAKVRQPQAMQFGVSRA